MKNKEVFIKKIEEATWEELYKLFGYEIFHPLIYFKKDFKGITDINVAADKLGFNIRDKSKKDLINAIKKGHKILEIKGNYVDMNHPIKDTRYYWEL